MAEDAEGTRGARGRDESGQPRDERDDAQTRTVEKKYNRDFGVRGDMHLDTFLEREGVDSPGDLGHGRRRRKQACPAQAGLSESCDVRDHDGLFELRQGQGKNSAGVMADDLLAGLYANLALHGIVRLLLR